MTEFPINKDIKLNNIKGLFIFLVVFGHIVEVYKADFYELFLLIYAFHMPLFVFISGYLAKRVKFSKIVNFLLLYLLFQIFVMIVDMSFDFDFKYDTSYFQLWYLVSMMVWYGVALVILKLRPSP